MANKKIEILEHTADLAVRINARDEPDLFETGAQAVYELVGQPVTTQAEPQDYPLEIEAGNREDLFHDWLAEILYFFQVRRVFFEGFRFEVLTPNHVKAVGRGRAIDVEKSHMRIEIKAVTYHHFRVESTPQGLIATVIFDI
jgi:SHS2 domain-containing protein